MFKIGMRFKATEGNATDKLTEVEKKLSEIKFDQCKQIDSQRLPLQTKRLLRWTRQGHIAGDKL